MDTKTKYIDFSKIAKLRSMIDDLEKIDEEEDELFVSAMLERIRITVNKMNKTSFLKPNKSTLLPKEDEIKADKQTFAGVVSKIKHDDEALMRMPQNKIIDMYSLKINEMTTKDYYVNFQTGTYHWMYLWGLKGSVMVKDNQKIFYQLRVNKGIPELALLFEDEWRWMKIGLIDIGIECHDDGGNTHNLKVKLVKFVSLESSPV